MPVRVPGHGQGHETDGQTQRVSRVRIMPSPARPETARQADSHCWCLLSMDRMPPDG